MAKAPVKPVPTKKPAAAAATPPKKGPVAATKPAPAPVKAKRAKPAPEPVEEVEEVEAEEGTVEEHGNKDLGIEELEAMWEDAEAPSFGDVPDNDYQVKILSAKREQKGGIWRVVFQLKILHTDQKGRMLWKRDNLDTEDRIGWFKAGVARLGHEVKSFKDLDGVLEELTGSYAEVSAKTKAGKGANEGKEFQNYHFNKALDVSDLEEADEDGEEPADEVVEGDVDGEPADGEEVEEAEDAEDAEAEDVDESDIPEEEDGGDADPEDEPTEEELADEAAVEEGAPPAAKPKGKRGKPAVVEPEVTIKFTEDQAKKAKSAIVQVAKKNDMDPNDYDNMCDLLADVGEYVGISGEFKTPEALILEINKRNRAAAAAK